MSTFGTAHFVSVRAANRYYAAYGHTAGDVLRKIIAGEIHIGKPAIEPGQKLTIIDNETGKRWDGRYAIETAELPPRDVVVGCDEQHETVTITDQETLASIKRIECLWATDLLQFTGSETIYRHSLVRAVTYTEGVQYLAEKAGAYWLIDKIATSQMLLRVGKEEFQSWKLNVFGIKDAGSAASLTCEDGNGNELYSEQIAFTDFPLPEITLWVEGGVILLPSEH